MKDILIGIVAVNQNYIDKAKKLMDQLLRCVDVNFLILTDKPIQFEQYNNTKVLEYRKEIFSYHDKRILFEEGFKLSDCVLLLDADHVVREVNDFNNIDIKILEPGVYPQLMWKHPNECSFENFILGKTPRVPYGVEYKRYCELLNLNIEKVFLIQESFVLIKKNEKIYDFLLIWEKLAKFCEDQDLKRNQHILGYGEGYSLGVSIRGADLKIFESNQVVNNIIKNFKHLAWEK